jgi:hypothetical protein
VTDQELIGYLEKIREEVRALREETLHRDNSLREENRQTRTALEAENRQTRVLVEGLRSDLQLVAEGLVGMGERLDEHKNEVLAKFEEVKATIAPRTTWTSTVVSPTSKRRRSGGTATSWT